MKNFETLLLAAPTSVKEMLEGLKGLRENPEYHPEPSTFEHIRIVTERLVDTGDVDLIVSGFFHDLFKLKTMTMNEKTGHPSSPLHDIAVAAFIRSDAEVQAFIQAQGANVEVVAFICEQHMRVKRLGEMRSSKRWALMSGKLFPKLCLFTLADKMSNDWAECLEKSKDLWFRGLEMMIGDVSVEWLMAERQKMLAHQEMGFTMEHKITGSDLIRMGFPQGRIIGMAIKLADEKLSDLPISRVLDTFRNIITYPLAYVHDENLGIIARELVELVD